jgi:hypothetical protein
MRALVARAIQVVVHVARLADGPRRVTGIAEVAEAADGSIAIHDVFTFEREAPGEPGAHRRVAKSVLPRLVKASNAQPTEGTPALPGGAS